ncbi:MULTISPECIES: hypothetical protein [unclassified Streptomyces]|uniref:hypothetical protein n=1 Tax=unclassified Streptomyces TaxID=2593676 RepID=UPI0022534E98|nr:MULTISPECIES: hypothetical protein [unclassified Streptomyces]MCX5327981.1 hypothetical protein [Streptomyces sp. NBC_00140]MCX5357471.1 hypothetical protein [Streptomyces sp. NBC_00124]
MPENTVNSIWHRAHEDYGITPDPGLLTFRGSRDNNTIESLMRERSVTRAAGACPA